MHKVVLGGCLASGKSTVASMMRDMGVEVRSLDDIAAEVRADPEVAGELAARFGDDVLDSDGLPIPAVLAQRAFADEQSTADLNAIMHPRIAAAAQAYLESPSGAPGVRVLEVPLLDKTPDLIELAHEVVCVTAPLEKRVERAVERGMDEADARARIERQASDEDLRAVADTVIENVGTIDDLRAKVWVWHAGRMFPAGR